MTIGSGGGIYCRGVGGASVTGSPYNSGAGGSSGGGTMIVGYGGTLSNSGTIDCNGGFISVADNSDRGPSGGDDYVLAATGGNGSVQLINLNA